MLDINFGNKMVCVYDVASWEHALQSRFTICTVTYCVTCGYIVHTLNNYCFAEHSTSIEDIDRFIEALRQRVVNLVYHVYVHVYVYNTNMYSMCE